jgi:DNA-binding LytR/AlgR family response regulator
MLVVTNRQRIVNEIAESSSEIDLRMGSILFNDWNEHCFFVWHNKRYIKILFADIRFVEGCKNYVKLHIGTKVYMTHATLKAVVSILPADAFIQVHKSFIVNLLYIHSFDHRFIYLENNEIPIGETFKEDWAKCFTASRLR